MGQFLKVSIHVKNKLHELLIAELGMLNYDSFQEQNDLLDAFIEESLFDKASLKEVLRQYEITTEYHLEKLKNVNWNEQWEKNFKPVYIEGKVQIRASFHQPNPDFPYDIVINPKMSFGTGHHETTSLIISEQLQLDHQNKKVLDLGTGTGVLAIMAHKLGAHGITVTDIDDWSIENSQENFLLNGIDHVKVLQGTIAELTLPDFYDIIFANINKNVLLAELGDYSRLLAMAGKLVLSGFYRSDLSDIEKKAMEAGLQFDKTNTINDWAVAVLSRGKK